MCCWGIQASEELKIQCKMTESSSTGGGLLDKEEPSIDGIEIYEVSDGSEGSIEVDDFYVPGDDIMHFTDSCRFLISSGLNFTALCTILPHCVQSYRTVQVQSYHTVSNCTKLCTILPHWGLEGGGDGP